MDAVVGGGLPCGIGGFVEVLFEEAFGGTDTFFCAWFEGRIVDSEGYAPQMAFCVLFPVYLADVFPDVLCLLFLF